MLSINVNTTALSTMRQLNLSSTALKTSIERLSTGFKINRAADNASNLSISKKMGTQLSGTKVAQENAQQAIALLDTADGALDEMTSIANRIRDLSLQAMNGTYSEKERQIMQEEVNKLTLELYRQRNSTKYNKMNIFGDSENPETQAESGILGGGGDL